MLELKVACAAVFFPLILYLSSLEEKSYKAPTRIGAFPSVYRAPLLAPKRVKTSLQKRKKPKRLVLRASWYGPRFHGRTRADNRIFNMYEPVVAHKFWPLGTLICVTNKANGKYGCFRVRDRGPYIEGRDLDFSLAAARQLGFEHAGLADVIVTDVSLPKKQRTSS